MGTKRLGVSRIKFGLAAAGRQVAGVVLDHVVKQGCAGQVRVGGPVMADDPDRDPQHVIDIRLALTAVGRVQPGRQGERLLYPVAVGGDEAGGLDREPLPAVRARRARR
jgi:hypothetical protein